VALTGHSVWVESTAAALTNLLREGTDAAWTALRDVLDGQGLDPARCVVAFSAEQGDDAEFAVLVTNRGEVVTCAWAPSTASALEWTTITAWWRDSPYRADVEQAMLLHP
jgi:hypothetical protein